MVIFYRQFIIFVYIHVYIYGLYVSLYMYVCVFDSFPTLNKT